MPKRIGELLSQPAPARAIVLGKGPSLARWTPGAADPPTFAINETCEKYPCDYAVYMDTWFAWGGRELNPPPHVMPIRHQQYADAQGGRGYIYYKDLPFPNRYVTATAPMIVAMLSVWGVKDILLVGFDALGTPDAPRSYVEGLDLRNELLQGDYKTINTLILEAADRYGGRLHLWHKGETLPCE